MFGFEERAGALEPILQDEFAANVTAYPQIIAVFYYL